MAHHVIVINQQQSYWAAYVAPWVAIAHTTVLLCEAPDYIGAHQIKHVHNFYSIHV